MITRLSGNERYILDEELLDEVVALDDEVVDVVELDDDAVVPVEVSSF